MRKTIVNKYLASLGVILTGGSAHADLVVTTGLSGNDLSNLLLGPGITLVGSPTLSEAEAGATGAFTGGLSAGLGFDSGIILTTGSAAGAVGPNNDTGFTGPGGGVISSLTFDFTTTGGDLFFNYIFASEEYNEYVNSSFNDNFFFLLDGDNIALIPGTGDPVEIDSVNNGANPAFYVDNDADAGTPFNVQYDGFTTVLTAQALGLSAGTHTIELIITDIGDDQLDSAVFIQGGSFADVVTPPIAEIPEVSSTLTLCGLLLSGLGFRRRK